MLKFLVNDEKTDPHTCDLSNYARAYLIKAGMEEEAIGLLLEKIR